MAAKLKFYEKYGVQEYYVYYAKKEVMQGYIRQGDNLVEIDNMDGWQSPLMKIWFRKEVTVNGRRRKVNWHFFLPNGEPFQTHGDAILLANDEKLRRQLAETERATALQQAKLERQQRQAAEARETAERQRAEAAETLLTAMATKLQAMGVNPDDILKS
jgi:hypothetical protein